MPAIALIPTDLAHGFFGQPAALDDQLAGRSVLEHTVRRAASITGVSRVVLVHPQDQNPLTRLNAANIKKPVAAFAYQPTQTLINHQRHLAAARKWALTSWRGGLGEATVYDELLPAGPLAGAMAEYHADAAVIVRADWPLFDTALAEHQLKIHRDAPEAMKITFTQAPPGLSAMVTSRQVLDSLAENAAGLGHVFGYNPHRPAIDPIGREANIAVDPGVRDCPRRFIYDLPCGKTLLQALAAKLGDQFTSASANVVTDACRAIEADEKLGATTCGERSEVKSCRTPAIISGYAGQHDLPCGTSRGTLPADSRRSHLPTQLTLELTTRRLTHGKLDPQSQVDLDRPDMDLAAARRVFEQLAAEDRIGDTVVMLGHLGDALLHPQWEPFVLVAHEAGVLGIGIETDLLCDLATITRLVELPVDLLAVRMDADNPQTYLKVRGVDRFGQVADNLVALVKARRGEQQETESTPRSSFLPWLVPKLIKTAETLTDMESFFERWSRTYGCHPVIEPALTGAGLIEDVNPIPMAPPRRVPCRQLGRRLTVLSDGRLALCDQDWLGRAAVGNIREISLAMGREALAEVAEAHERGRFDASALCAQCTHWHRP